MVFAILAHYLHLSIYLSVTYCKEPIRTNLFFMFTIRNGGFYSTSALPLKNLVWCYVCVILNPRLTLSFVHGNPVFLDRNPDLLV